ncbi:hypothetical protein [Halorarius litoreus]|uniref:hypothetical protein n=1 Tax=Halorarius litoreus TaxID=2962676 RepID=UPI0020CD812B|nr:hypothetical protein [Halorarius litoreus]
MIEQYLERLFTWESLVNTERGVEFELKNRLDDARLTGFDGVAIDGEPVPLDDVTIHREDGTALAPADISEDAPLQFDLAETVQVVCARPRLRRGSHELTVELSIEGFGGLSFTTDDEVVDADLVDADPADHTVAELRDLVRDVRDPLTLDRLLDREQTGKARKSAIEAIERRRDALDPVESSDDDAEPSHEPSELAERTQELLSLVVETPQQVQVYTAGWVGGPGTTADIADRTLFSEARVQMLLGELELQDLVERDGDRYEMVHPVVALQRQPRNLWSLLRP